MGLGAGPELEAGLVRGGASFRGWGLSRRRRAFPQLWKRFPAKAGERPRRGGLATELLVDGTEMGLTFRWERRGAGGCQDTDVLGGEGCTHPPQLRLPIGAKQPNRSQQPRSRTGSAPGHRHRCPAGTYIPQCAFQSLSLPMCPGERDLSLKALSPVRISQPGSCPEATAQASCGGV